jgi:hypothetical protein
MPAPDWISYVGAITGVAGSVMGFVGLRRGFQSKALDLRIELRRQDLDYDNGLAALLGLIPYAKDSRIAVNAPIGHHGSGMELQWLAGADEDLARVRAEFEARPRGQVDFSRLNHAELETMLIETHRRLAVVSELRDKYKAGLASDESHRERLRNRPYVVIPK